MVHINAGVAALVAAIIIGKRKGFPDTAMPPHNLTMTVAGAAMLWVGWFGFNAGSALAANESAAMAHVSHPSWGGLWLASLDVDGMEALWKAQRVGYCHRYCWAGLGTITPASGFVGPLGAVIIGAAAGWVCFMATQTIKRVLKIDDSLDVFPVHGIGGMLGTLMAVLGLLLDGMKTADLASGKITLMSQFATQFIGVVATVAWCACMSFVIFKIIDVGIGLRVSEEEETQGLDIVLHEETGYNL